MNTNTKKGLAKANAPLHSWDIFMYAYKRRIELSADLQTLQTIQRQYNWSTPAITPGYALIWLNKVVVITNTAMQVIYVTENIFEMTGYKPGEVIGNKPSMFQGKETTLESRNIISSSVANSTHFETVIINYKKDGTPYKCHVDGYPVFNKKGQLVNFLAFESAVY